MEQFNLEKWLKDKSRKVVTRDGRLARIICTDCGVRKSQPILVEITCSRNTKVLGYYNIDGTTQDKNLNLFFADDEEELTDFESDLFTAFSDAWQQYLRGESVNVAEWAKDHSKDLIESARKELEHSAVEFAKSYMEDANPSFEKVKESEELWNWKMSCLRGVNKAYTQGKQDALKELEHRVMIPEEGYYEQLASQYHKGHEDALKSMPKWKKCVGSTGPFIDDFKGEAYLYLNDYVIKISDLELLPKEE